MDGAALVRNSVFQRWVRAMARVLGAVALLGVLLPAAQVPARPPVGQASSPAARAVPAVRKANNVAVITIKDEITKVTATSVERRMKLAARAGADAIVFEIDTPGGDLYAALTICSLIKQSPIPNTVAWVNTKAYSAGAVIALACREIVTAQAADFGDAIPINVDPIRGMIPMGESERQKVLAPLLAEVVDSARQRGYDEYLVQAFVAIGVEVWLVEHVQTGARLCVNRDEYRLLFGEDPPVGGARIASAPSGGTPPPPPPPAPDPQAGASREPDTQPGAIPIPESDRGKKFVPATPALAPLAGETSQSLVDKSVSSRRPVITGADRGKWRLIELVTEGRGPLVLKADDMRHYGFSTDTIRTDQELQDFFGARNIRRIDPSWSEGLVAFLTNIVVQGILVVILLIALFLEMTHPGLILPGSVAAVALFALLAPSFLIGMAGWWEVAAIVGGIVLILLEVFVIPGFGVTGIVGILALFGGLIGVFVPHGSGGLFPDTPQAREELLYGFTTVVLSAATAGVGMYLLAKHFGSLPLLGRLVLKTPENVDGDGAGMFGAIDPSGIGLRPGMTGIAITPLRPSGRMQVGDKIIDAVADLGWIPSGATVRIVSATAFRIGVEMVAPPAEPPAQNPPAAGQNGGAVA